MNIPDCEHVTHTPHTTNFSKYKHTMDKNRETGSKMKPKRVDRDLAYWDNPGGQDVGFSDLTHFILKSFLGLRQGPEGSN